MCLQAMLYKNGKKIDETRDKAGGNGTKKTFSFHFGNGDRIALKERSEETYNTVIWLGSISFDCPPALCKGSTCGDDDVAACCDERTACGLTGWAKSSRLCVHKLKNMFSEACNSLFSFLILEIVRRLHFGPCSPASRARGFVFVPPPSGTSR